MDTVFPVMSTKEKDSLSIRLFGNRLQGDQTLGEYLLEFLLVFSSAKKDDESGKFEFHTMDQTNSRGAFILHCPAKRVKEIYFLR